MLGLCAMLVASAMLATAISPFPIAGTLASIGATPSGASLTIDKNGGGRVTLAIPPDALVQERAAGKEWQRVSLAALKAKEPLTVRFDAAGRPREVDAEYTLVLTRAVVVDRGFLVGTDGIARKLVAAASGMPAIPLGAYVALRTNPATGEAFDASISSHPFAEAAKAPTVAVTFDVRVPANTPPAATIYLATNAQAWTANAIRLTPEPGNRWTATVHLAGGAVLQYKYTRGSWTTGERDSAGAEIPNRTLTVAGDAKTQDVGDVVVRWADLPS